RLFLHELATQYEIGEHPLRVPPEAHAAHARGDAVLEGKVSGAALSPAIVHLPAQERSEARFALLGAGDEFQICRRDFLDLRQFDPAIVTFGGFRLKLDFAVA